MNDSRFARSVVKWDFLSEDTYVIASVLLIHDKRRIRRTSASISILKSCNQSSSFSAICANRIIQTFFARISGRDKSNQDQNDEQKFHVCFLGNSKSNWICFQISEISIRIYKAHMSLDFIVVLCAKKDFLNGLEVWKNIFHAFHVQLHGWDFPSLKNSKTLVQKNFYATLL